MRGLKKCKFQDAQQMQKHHLLGQSMHEGQRRQFHFIYVDSLPPTHTVPKWMRRIILLPICSVGYVLRDYGEMHALRDIWVVEKERVS